MKSKYYVVSVTNKHERERCVRRIIAAHYKDIKYGVAFSNDENFMDLFPDGNLLALRARGYHYTIFRETFSGLYDVRHDLLKKVCLFFLDIDSYEGECEYIVERESVKSLEFFQSLFYNVISMPLLVIVCTDVDFTFTLRHGFRRHVVVRSEEELDEEVPLQIAGVKDKDKEEAWFIRSCFPVLRETPEAVIGWFKESRIPNMTSLHAE